MQLKDAADRAQLRAEFARIVGVVGGPWFDGRIVRPTTDDLPFDARTRTEQVGRMMACLLDHAGLSHLHVHVSTASLATAGNWADSRGSGESWSAPTVRIDGVEDETVYVLFDPDVSGDEVVLAGECADQVSRLVMTSVGLDAQTSAALVAVALGFGVLIANATGYVLASGDLYTTQTLTMRASDVGLEPVAYLLAAQVLRDRSSGADVGALLSRNGEAQFIKWLTHLRANPAEIADLDVSPGRTLEPVTPDPEDHTSRVHIGSTEADHRKATADARVRRNRGRTVFRVPRTSRSSDAAQRFAALSFAGFVLGSVAGSSTPGILVGAGLALASLGVRPYRATRFRCSDNDCAGEITLGDDKCPGCSGHIRGELRSASERLEAIEAIEDSDIDDPWYQDGADPPLRRRDDPSLPPDVVRTSQTDAPSGQSGADGQNV